MEVELLMSVKFIIIDELSGTCEQGQPFQFSDGIISYIRLD